MKIIKNILLWVSIISLFLTVVIVFSPKLFHVSFCQVASISMQDVIPKGSLIVVSPRKTENIHVGDIVTYEEKGNPGKFITHKVMSIDRKANTFITKGTKNTLPDPDPVQYRQIKGVVIFHVAGFGKIFDWFQHQGNRVIVAAVIVAMFAASSVLGFFLENKKKTKKGLKDNTEDELEDRLQSFESLD